MVREFVAFLAGIAGACAREGLFAEGPVLLSAGGSAFYDLVVDGFGRAEIGRETIVLTRSGCYLTHDSALYKDFFARLETRTPAVEQLGEGLKPALELWAYVQSRPESEKAILTLGKRDASFDAGLPVPTLWFRPGTHERPAPFGEGCTVTELNDQHTHMTVPAESPLTVGDMVAFGVSHPCTTFDKWQYMFIVDDDYRVVSAIRTFF
jgi:D-serine dehydratase